MAGRIKSAAVALRKLLLHPERLCCARWRGGRLLGGSWAGREGSVGVSAGSVALNPRPSARRCSFRLARSFVFELHRRRGARAQPRWRCVPPSVTRARQPTFLNGSKMAIGSGRTCRKMGEHVGRQVQLWASSLSAGSGVCVGHWVRFWGQMKEWERRVSGRGESTITVTEVARRSFQLMHGAVRGAFLGAPPNPSVGGGDEILPRVQSFRRGSNGPPPGGTARRGELQGGGMITGAIGTSAHDILGGACRWSVLRGRRTITSSASASISLLRIGAAAIFPGTGILAVASLMLDPRARCKRDLALRSSSKY